MLETRWKFVFAMCGKNLWFKGGLNLLINSGQYVTENQ